MLHLTVPYGDSLVIDEGRIVVTLIKNSNQEVKCVIDADKSILIQVAPKERRAPWVKGLSASKTTPNKSGA